MGLLGLSDNMQIFGCQLRDSRVLFFKEGKMKQKPHYLQIYSTSIFEAKNCAEFSIGDSASRRLGENKGSAREVEVAEMMRRKEENLLRVFAQNLFPHFLPQLSLNRDSPPRPAGNFSLPPRRAQTCLGGSLPRSHCHLHMRRRSRWRTWSRWRRRWRRAPPHCR